MILGNLPNIFMNYYELITPDERVFRIGQGGPEHIKRQPQRRRERLLTIGWLLLSKYWHRHCYY